RGWFDRLCADSRSNFIVSKQRSKVHVQSHSVDDLMSAQECYNYIKRNIKSNKDMDDDVFWKIPILLLILGCALVVSMAFCYVLQRLVTKVKKSRLQQNFNFDVCHVEKAKSHNSSPHSSHHKSTKEKNSSCCSCCSSNPK
ncbi:hypothetical protein KR009_003811, partial [Drosophila setifemur]